MPKRKQIPEAECQELFAILEQDDGTLINNATRTVTFNINLLQPEFLLFVYFVLAPSCY